MGKLPTLATKARYSVNTTTFRGLHHAPVIEDGQMYDMDGMTGDQYPLAAARKPRGMVRPMLEPQGIIAKERLWTIEGEKLLCDGRELQGVQMMVSRSDGGHQMVSMGAYLCIWPEKIWINTATLAQAGSAWTAEHGQMGARWSRTGTGKVKLAMCRMDGSVYASGEITKSVEPPEKPENGQLWLDTSAMIHALKRWNEGTKEWVQLLTTYVRIEAAGIGAGFQRDDGVKISGMETGDREKMGQVRDLNGDNILMGAGDNYLIVTGILDGEIEIDTDVVISRDVPDMDFVTESNNRIWGCRYGADEDGTLLNEIYACKLGDFKNWRVYAGLSTDSYAVSVGLDGRFTGAGTLKSYPVFFKDNALIMIAGSMPSQYTLKTINARGVQEGSWRSVCVVGEMLYYKSRTGVMAWDGSIPVEVGEPLGTDPMYEAAAGSNGNKYMISMRTADYQWAMYEYDTMRGLWHKTNGIHATGFAELGGECWYIDAGKGWLIAANGTEGQSEGRVEWSVTFGVVGYESEEQKYLSRYNLRMGMERGCEVTMWLQYDSDGEWHKMGEIVGRCTTTYLVPVIPHRCDHCQLKLTGKGPVRIFGIARTMELGGDGQWHG